MDKIKEDWKPHLNFSTILTGIYFLITDPKPNDLINHEADPSDTVSNERLFI